MGIVLGVGCGFLLAAFGSYKVITAVKAGWVIVYLGVFGTNIFYKQDEPVAFFLTVGWLGFGAMLLWGVCIFGALAVAAM